MTGECPAPAHLLPHSYPFVLIDKIIEREENKRIVCLKNVTYNEEFFQGHFKGRPIMPGVLIIEAMAQASGLILSADQPSAVFLGRISDARFKKAVVPGDQLIIKSSLIKEFRPLYVFEASAYVEGVIVAEAEITLTIA
ncbi:MAG: 3-hydroxyacyl-ACP dehydratase FabZ [Dissulfurispiraceae bacterium]